MKMIMNVILVVIAFSWISGVSAGNGSGKQSPESIVTCSGAGTTHPSLPETINAEQCVPWGASCASCIISLENQGCEVVDVTSTNFISHETHGTVIHTGTTYLLSCVKP